MAANTLNFGGGITAGAAGTTTLTLAGTNTGANTISGIIADGSATQLAVSKTGTGTWFLAGANTYTGGTTVNGGTLNINGDSAFGTAPSPTDAVNLIFTGNSTLQAGGPTVAPAPLETSRSTELPRSPSTPTAMRCRSPAW